MRQAFSNLLPPFEACVGGGAAAIVIQSDLDPSAKLARLSVSGNGPIAPAA